MYTGRFVHSGMAREELSPIGIEGPDLNESVRGASVVEEPKVERARARNSWGPSRCPLLDWQEPAGPAEKCKNVQETTEIRGQSWRKLPGQKRVGPRNSSGSVTS